MKSRKLLTLKRLDLTTDLRQIDLRDGRKSVVNTINTYSYIHSRKDRAFAEALTSGDFLIPDGMGIVLAGKILGIKPKPGKRIAGWDLFLYEMERLNARGGKCFFMGSSDDVLSKVQVESERRWPNVEVMTYSPPYMKEFDDATDDAIVQKINDFEPDLLWIGLSAPKQEKWVAKNAHRLKVNGPIGSIGAVFSFLAGTEKRAPEAWQKAGFEWLYRFVHDPRRLYKRYVNGNLRFAACIIGALFTK